MELEKIQKKLESLKGIIKETEGVLVAYSGGIDSTFLLKVALSVLGKNVIAVTVNSEVFAKKEIENAKKIARILGVKNLIIKIKHLNDENFVINSILRCYYCKKKIFSELLILANKFGFKNVIEGSNYDDTMDFRPGMRALKELGIKSPLKEAMLNKDEIRILSKQMKLPNWDKPPSPCLATRIPYGVRITKEELLKIESAEEFLLKLGFREVRVRSHFDIARIEIPKYDIKKIFEMDRAEKIVRKFREIGYKFITIDLEGYRKGSMNEEWIEKE
jgi:uncharacterized protein